MKRQDKPTRATVASHQADDSDDRLHVPDDWDDAADLATADSASETDNGRDFDDVEDDPNERAQRMHAMLRAGPPKLVQALFALEGAKTEDDIAAARAILRVSAF